MEVWVDGIRKKTDGDTIIRTIECEQPRRALELFSGTGRTGDVLRKRGYEVTSVDIDPRAGADICEDVMAWDFRKYPRGDFELIVASPPCTEYSRAKTIGARDLEGADAFVQRTL
jgi:site-specific DNA-cytosine methylase